MDNQRNICGIVFLLLLFCFPAYAAFKTDIATFDVVDIELKAVTIPPPIGFIRIYGDLADRDLKAKDATGNVVTIGDFP